MKILKILIKVIGGIIVLALCFALIALIRVNIITDNTQNDFAYVYTDEKYKKPILIDNVKVIKQDISCGYAVIEMFSAWKGGNITEESLYSQYGSVVTSSGDKFCEEMNKQFPEYKTTIHKYLKNTEFIDIMYKTLSSGKPVPFEWAAKCGEEWTLHYSLIIGADIPGDEITVANPYGYIEKLTLRELFDRTSFKAFENMPLAFKMAFAIGMFEKNTLFSVE